MRTLAYGHFVLGCQFENQKVTQNVTDCSEADWSFLSIALVVAIQKWFQDLIDQPRQTLSNHWTK